MIWEQNTDEKCIFTDFMQESDWNWCERAKVDTVEARKKILGIQKKCAETLTVIDRIEKAEGKTDLYSRYVKGELPHIYESEDPFFNVFCDALSIQADRIIENIQKKYNATAEDIREIIFCDTNER